MSVLYSVWYVQGSRENKAPNAPIELTAISTNAGVSADLSGSSDGRFGCVVPSLSQKMVRNLHLSCRIAAAECICYPTRFPFRAEDSYVCREILHVDIVVVIPCRFVLPERLGFISVKSRQRWTASGT